MSTSPSDAAGDPAGVTLPRTALTLRLLAASAPEVLATCTVTASHLRDPLAELWWHAHARHGHFGHLVDDMRVIVRPLRDTADRDRCRGFSVTTTNEMGDAVKVTCPLPTLQPLAHSMANELVASGVLVESDSFRYELRHRAGTDQGAVQKARQGELVARSRDLCVAALPLTELRRRSDAAGPEPHPHDHELFFTDTALERAERIARHGERLDPRVETGGILIGYVAYCPATGDAFVLVVDALEARDADRQAFSLTFHSQTWQRLQSMVSARRRQPGQRALRLLGQTHGHPFEAGQPCAACPQTPDCHKHTAYLSDDDRRWSRAVFAGQPWQVGQLFGTNARGEPTDKVYGLRGGRLEPRGYRVIAARDLDAVRPSDPPSDHPSDQTTAAQTSTENPE